MNMIEKIRAEMKRQIHMLRSSIQSQGDYGQSCQIVAYENLLSFLFTLESEKPMQEGLEEEYKDYVENDPVYSKLVNRNAGLSIARHFAEWGEKNAYKAIMKKADEVRDKRFDADYEVKIEPAAGFDFGCVNVYHEGKLVGQYVEPKEEKKLSEGVDEAAYKYSFESRPSVYGQVDVIDAFKAGAAWQYQKDRAEFAKLKAREWINGYNEGLLAKGKEDGE